MSACEQLTEAATSGVAPALKAVDCVANASAADAFGRLFGGGGALTTALTIGLTLYIAFFALSLLTGRSKLSISALSPRMMTVGFVLTLATSWVAYQNVVWNVAVAGPDEIAGVVMGVKGSATELFASRIDAVFAAIAEVGQNATETSQGAAQQAGTFTPSNLMWLSAVMLLLSTVGVLVTAKIALAVLLAIGPVFVTLALFRGTRGLFAGWLRGVALTACASLFAVLGGGFMLELVVPIVARLREAEAIDSGAVLALFLVCAVHVALMGMVFSVMGTMVSAWSVFGLVMDRNSAPAPSHAAAPAVAAPALATAAAGRAGAVAEKLSINRAAETAGAMHRAADRRGGGRAVAPAIAPLRPQGGQRSRNRGVGSTYRQPVHSHREFIR